MEHNTPTNMHSSMECPYPYIHQAVATSRSTKAFFHVAAITAEFVNWNPFAHGCLPNM
jgi:hypothetical protein